MPNTAADRVIHVVAGLIRHRKNAAKIFITRRQKGQHLEDLWEFPGGKIEAGESRFNALKRELEEEIGIRVIAALPFQSVLYSYPDKHILLDVWEVTQYQGQARGLEGQETHWLSVKEIDGFEFPPADLPVLSALSLPQSLLITPDVVEQHEEEFVIHFQRLMSQQAYPLVQFRSHNLNDKSYARMAQKLQAVCEPYKAELVIQRRSLKSLQSSSFKSFKHRHLGASLLQSLPDNPFEEGIQLSASCHDSQELAMAERLGCQYALLSTVRDTPSHPGRHGKGWFKLKNTIEKTQLPVYALGGVRRKDFCVARFQGAIGVAGISDFWTV